ncbi:MAG TPA: hypothetical protein VH352_13435 [Pseudonocardiaceae bacterium]|jgi:hypothetical protein|nr:hypothetical protein [Pseudonocardiaceae bacterium]
MFTFRSSLRAAIVLIALCCAGCAAAPSGPGVAALGSSPTSSAAAKASSDNGFDQMLAFSACMRSHGVKDFPDPTRDGTGGGGASLRIQGGSGSDLSPGSAVFQAAQRACQSLMPKGSPNGVKVDPTKIAAWAACLRSHGLPNFPDPTVSNGALSLKLDGTGITPDSSQFQKAMTACRSLNPGGGVAIQGGGGK